MMLEFFRSAKVTTIFTALFKTTRHQMSMMDHYQQYGVTTAFVSPLYILTMIAESLSNGLIIYSYVTDNSIRKTFYFLITNLAIANLLISLLFTPITN